MDLAGCHGNDIFPHVFSDLLVFDATSPINGRVTPLLKTNELKILETENKEPKLGITTPSPQNYL